ncbi:MAG: hypothetical protein SF182_14965 [Deltaproteobacteria bacterium]|nr:hypothetical protein [Deltaproteobacteria bacterium]
MREWLLAGFLVAALAGSAAATTTVKGTKSNGDNRLQSKLTTGSVILSAASETKRVYKTPASGDFTLTQICVSPAAAGGILVSIEGFGALAHLGGAESCATFDPGVVLPANANIACSTFESATAGNYFCMISGLQAPALRP